MLATQACLCLSLARLSNHNASGASVVAVIQSIFAHAREQVFCASIAHAVRAALFGTIFFETSEVFIKLKYFLRHSLFVSLISTCRL